MEDIEFPSFVDEAVHRREQIADDLKHLARDDDNLRQRLARNACRRGNLIDLDSEYAEAIASAVRPHVMPVSTERLDACCGPTGCADGND